MGTNADFATFVEQLETVFDRAVNEGTDDELFASGYLRGHFDLVVAQLELQQQAETQQVLPALADALHATKHELAPVDQGHIKAMFARLEAAAAAIE